MSSLDWGILLVTISFIVIYGAWRTRDSKNIEGYLKGDNSMKWWMIGISIMATQASAVTFLSTPGQAIEDGMRFLQFYFGLPIAMVIISVTMVPLYYKLKVYTAYEYLESRFDLKTRTLTAIFFLVLRGLSSGITLYAPALVLSTIMGWPIHITTVIIGILVIIYVVIGGTRAVSLTQRQQMFVIMTGMILAGILAYVNLPSHVTFSNTITLAGELGKFNLVDFDFDITSRYNIWSGLIAGTFLFLAYFGTDQSQVGRYLSGTSITESRLGLLLNGLLKIPMQFMILFIGVLVYVFYLFNQAPLFHNQVLYKDALQTTVAENLESLHSNYNALTTRKQAAVYTMVDAIQHQDHHLLSDAKQTVLTIEEEERTLRNEVKEHIAKALPAAKVQDRDYIFLNFVLSYLPHGIIGLILAVMFSAAMSSMAGELNALSSTTTVDIYKRSIKQGQSDTHYLNASRFFTILWAVFAIVFAIMASFAENLIQYVNIVGSLFYGTILGVFLTAFYIKFVKSNAIFIAAIIGECVIFYCYLKTDIAFLLYNIIGCITVITVAIILQIMEEQVRKSTH
jgi:SSS family solute:Na+ symporter